MSAEDCNPTKRDATRHISNAISYLLAMDANRERNWSILILQNALDAMWGIL